MHLAAEPLSEFEHRVMLPFSNPEARAQSCIE